MHRGSRAASAALLVLAVLACATGGCGGASGDVDPTAAAGRPPRLAPAVHVGRGRYPLLRREPTKATPIRLLFLGDSIALTMLPSVALASERLGVEWTDATRLGFGFTSDRPARDGRREIDPAFPRWRHEVDDLVTKHDPDVVTVLVGAWDLVDREVDGSWLVPGTSAWRTWYDGVLDETVARLTRKGSRVVWMGMPCVDTRYADRVHTVNDAYRAAAKRHPDRVRFVDFTSRACPDGRFTRSLTDAAGKRITIRDHDGVHFEMYAAAGVFPPWLAGELARSWGGAAP